MRGAAVALALGDLALGVGGRRRASRLPVLGSGALMRMGRVVV